MDDAIHYTPIDPPHSKQAICCNHHHAQRSSITLVQLLQSYPKPPSLFHHGRYQMHLFFLIKPHVRLNLLCFLKKCQALSHEEIQSQDLCACFLSFLPSSWKFFWWWHLYDFLPYALSLALLFSWKSATTYIQINWEQWKALNLPCETKSPSPVEDLDDWATFVCSPWPSKILQWLIVRRYQTRPLST